MTELDLPLRGHLCSGLLDRSLHGTEKRVPSCERFRIRERFTSAHLEHVSFDLGPSRHGRPLRPFATRPPRRNGSRGSHGRRTFTVARRPQGMNMANEANFSFKSTEAVRREGVWVERPVQPREVFRGGRMVDGGWIRISPLEVWVVRVDDG